MCTGRVLFLISAVWTQTSAHCRAPTAGSPRRPEAPQRLSRIRKVKADWPQDEPKEHLAKSGEERSPEPFLPGATVHSSHTLRTCSEPSKKQHLEQSL